MSRVRFEVGWRVGQDVLDRDLLCRHIDVCHALNSRNAMFVRQTCGTFSLYLKFIFADRFIPLAWSTGGCFENCCVTDSCLRHMRDQS